MKIEKVNDHQIRCTLTKEDLAKRQLKVSELAYGTEKARELFQEMMHQANTRLGFNAEDVPLMIEAIPINSECIVLVITKSEDPEELDTRFSQFGPSVEDDSSTYDKEDMDYSEEMDQPDEDEVMDLFHRLQDGDFSGFLDDATASSEARKVKSKTAGRRPAQKGVDNFFYCFRLPTLYDVMRLPTLIPSNYKGRNTLFSDPESGTYLLAMYGDKENKVYTNLCHLIAEYAKEEDMAGYSIDYLEEHYPVVVADSALQKMGSSMH